MNNVFEYIKNIKNHWKKEGEFYTKYFEENIGFYLRLHFYTNQYKTNFADLLLVIGGYQEVFKKEKIKTKEELKYYVNLIETFTLKQLKLLEEFCDYLNELHYQQYYDGR